VPDCFGIFLVGLIYYLPAKRDFKSLDRSEIKELMQGIIL
jgi:hypothetical protein